MFTFIFGERSLLKIRELLNDGTLSVRVGLLSGFPSSGEIADIEDLASWESVFPGYARQLLPAGVWSLPFTADAMPTIVANIVVAQWDGPDEDATYGPFSPESSTFVVVDGVTLGFAPTVAGYFLMLTDGSTDELILTKAFSPEVLFTDDTPSVQFAPTVAFDRLAP